MKLIHPFFTNFILRVSLGKEDIFDLSGEAILTILADKCIIKSKPVIICADPFLYSSSKKLFLFYEEQKGYYNNGIIKMTSTTNLINWSYPITVLKEPFHLSFPFVFNDNGGTYMVPESYQDGSIRLYLSLSENLEKWDFVQKLIDDNNAYVDSSITKIDGVYFLFTTRIEHKRYYQVLYYSHSLFDEFKEHIKSPLISGKDFSRNAGSVFLYKGELFRPTQHCSAGYGNQVSVFRIDTINKNEYSESLYKKNIINQDLPFYTYGGHHFNMTFWNDKSIVASDARSPYWNLIKPINWLLHKITL